MPDIYDEQAQQIAEHWNGPGLPSTRAIAALLRQANENARRPLGELFREELTAVGVRLPAERLATEGKPVAGEWENLCRRVNGRIVAAESHDDGRWLVYPEWDSTDNAHRGNAPDPTSARLAADAWAREHAAELDWQLPTHEEPGRQAAYSEVSAFAALDEQILRYADKRGLPDSVRSAWRERQNNPEAGHALLIALTAFLRHDGGDYGLRSAFDAWQVGLPMSPAPTTLPVDQWDAIQRAVDNPVESEQLRRLLAPSPRAVAPTSASATAVLVINTMGACVFPVGPERTWGAGPAMCGKPPTRGLFCDEHGSGPADDIDALRRQLATAQKTIKQQRITMTEHLRQQSERLATLHTAREEIYRLTPSVIHRARVPVDGIQSCEECGTVLRLLREDMERAWGALDELSDYKGQGRVSETYNDLAEAIRFVLDYCDGEDEHAVMDENRRDNERARIADEIRREELLPHAFDEWIADTRKILCGETLDGERDAASITAVLARAAELRAQRERRETACTCAAEDVAAFVASETPTGKQYPETIADVLLTMAVAADCCDQNAERSSGDLLRLAMVRVETWCKRVDLRPTIAQIIDEIDGDPERLCVCDDGSGLHRRWRHVPVNGSLTCTVAGCACGPGCIHEGFVDASGGHSIASSVAPPPASVDALLLRAILEQPTAFDWSLQGFGMFRLYLSREARLHLWDPRFAVENVSTLHTHPWDFTSTVIAGRIEDHVYRIEPGDPTHVEQRIVCGSGGCAVGEPGAVRLVPAFVRSVRAGESYTLRSDEIHESRPEPGTVTIIRRTFKADTEHANVYHPIGTPWVSAEPRKAAAAEVISMAEIARAVLSRLLAAAGGQTT